MTDHRWTDVYDYACKAFGQTPRPEDEEAIIQAFEQNPLLVMKMIDDVANALGNGEIKWAWSTFAARVNRSNTTPAREVIADTGHSKERLILRAEQWIRNTGCHFDRESEVEDELFGDRGLLQGYPDQLLKQRMLTLWQQCRPEGERIEAETIQAANKWKTWKQAEAKALAPSDT
jgi:hypothetical protein